MSENNGANWLGHQWQTLKVKLEVSAIVKEGPTRSCRHCNREWDLIERMDWIRSCTSRDDLLTPPPFAVHLRPIVPPPFHPSNFRFTPWHAISCHQKTYTLATDELRTRKPVDIPLAPPVPGSMRLKVITPGPSGKPQNSWSRFRSTNSTTALGGSASIQDACELLTRGSRLAGLCDCLGDPRFIGSVYIAQTRNVIH